ncbi:MAG: methylaspartate mutase subunit S [Chloroflexi bacterium]|nr:methylaspartate mutase subunit S [Chloroflexota bacterium]
MEPVTIVSGVLGPDIHIIGNTILNHALRQAGFNVVGLGIFNSQEDFINAAIETNARAIMVSSLHGHGEIDATGFRVKCVEAGLKDILLYIGGNLVVGKQEWAEVERRFKALGFDRVYPPKTRPAEAISALREDLGLPADFGAVAGAAIEVPSAGPASEIGG